jgi:hypothetical protein
LQAGGADARQYQCAAVQRQILIGSRAAVFRKLGLPGAFSLEKRTCTIPESARYFGEF